MLSKKLITPYAASLRGFVPRGLLESQTHAVVKGFSRGSYSSKSASNNSANRCANDPSLLPREIENQLDHYTPGTAKNDLLYNKEADALLEEMALWAEGLNWDEIETVDCQNGVLQIDLAGDHIQPEGLTRTIVINKHYVNKQMWYSSPISGGDYFPFSNDWNSLRSKLHIREKLREDLKILTGHDKADGDNIGESFNEIFDSPIGEQLFPTVHKTLEQRRNHLEKSDDFLKNADVGDDSPIIIDFTTSTLGVNEAELFLKKCFDVCEQLPRVQSDTNFNKLSTLLIQLEYQGESLWTTDFRIDLILEAHWEGFLVIAYECKFKFKQNPCFFEILLPRLHLNRSCVRLDERNPRPAPKSVRKRCRKLSNLQFTVDKNLTSVLEGLSKQHQCCWVNSLMKRLWKHWQSLESRLVEMNLPTLHSIEIWDGDTLVAGEVGGSIYTSLTGFYSVSGTGSIQLWALSAILRSCGYSVWDLGMYMEYKMDLAAVVLNRKDFIELFRAKRDIQPLESLKQWRDSSSGGVSVSSIVH